MSYLYKEIEKGNFVTWYDSESEEETANIVMAYSDRCESNGESSTKDLFEEDLDTSYRLLFSK